MEHADQRTGPVVAKNNGEYVTISVHKEDLREILHGNRNLPHIIHHITDKGIQTDDTPTSDLYRKINLLEIQLNTSKKLCDMESEQALKAHQEAICKHKIDAIEEVEEVAGTITYKDIDDFMMMYKKLGSNWGAVWQKMKRMSPEVKIEDEIAMVDNNGLVVAPPAIMLVMGILTMWKLKLLRKW
ncbi:hypothetical protein SERLA73DRAFT_152114 [Serpula lacrymans var. lacrymans S7.3]|uniref:Uncharacterized protein n=1 Tax=Serpula lacrymans var. lacrymans (strain S7.3) TaxID=936435 RepID=F8PWE4_SERL3|nr:hypothetical protein SERLA73DRAFT_152114 [Serpula lacrymans var. lacrymans S7.3]